MQKHLIAAITALIVMVALFGCSNPEAAVIGNWTVSNPAQAQASSQTVAFKADHTFTGGSAQQAIEGKWSLKGKIVKFQVVKIGGKSVDEVKAQMEKLKPLITGMAGGQKKYDDAMKVFTDGADLTLSDDGKTMSGGDSFGGGTFTKVTTPS